MKTFKEYILEKKTFDKADVKTLNVLGQRIFDSNGKCKMYEVKWRTGAHPTDGMNDVKDRNEKPITMAHLVRILKKGIPQLCKRMEEFMNKKGCFIDKKTYTNLPFTVTDDADGVINVNTNTAQNKKDYWLFPDQIPIYIN